MSVGVLTRAGSGGAVLSAFRLPAVSDDQAVLPTGAYGDDLEYPDQTTLDNVWVARPGTIARPLGSSIGLSAMNAAGRGILRSVAGFAGNFEVAFLFQSSTPYLGPVIVDAAGNGLGVTRDSGTIYLMILTAYAYSGDGPAIVSAHPFGLTVAPVWVAIRKAGTTYRIRASVDGVTWTTLVSKVDALVPDRVGVMSVYGPPNALGMAIVHRMVYGAPDLGFA